MSLAVGTPGRDAVATSHAPVVTVTPAPAIDRVYGVPRLLGGGHHRAVAARPELAGKGVRLSRALAAAGAPTRAVLPLGVVDRQSLDLDDDAVCIDVPWSARTNVIVTDSDGTTTNLNAEPHPLTQEEWEALTFAALRAAVEIDAAWLVVAGSFPRIVGTERTIDLVPLVRAAHDLDLRVAVDSSGAGLRAVLDPAVRVDLIKPNHHELAELVRRPIRTIGDALDASEQVRAAGVRRVVVSLGEDGALSVGETVHWVSAPPVPVVNTTGAGDSMLAGYLAAAHDDDAGTVARALGQGVAWGAAAVQDLVPGDVDPAALPLSRAVDRRHRLR